MTLDVGRRGGEKVRINLTFARCDIEKTHNLCGDSLGYEDGYFMYTWCLTSTETIRLIRDGEKGGKGVGRWGKMESIYLSLHCHHQSHFNVSLTVRDKVTRQCPQTATFEKKGEPKRIRTEIPLLTSLLPYR